MNNVLKVGGGAATVTTILAAILTLAQEHHDTSTPLTNDAVQEMTGLSDTTCAVYLRELVTRGFLTRHGKGRGVRYELI